MDTISNMLTAIVNAQRVKKQLVAVPYSSFKENLAKFMRTKGILVKTRVQTGRKPKLVMTLAYVDNQPVIHSVTRISKPGNRKYFTTSKLPYTGHRPGLYIISTSKGLMDQDQARRAGIGGETICAVWLNQ